MMEPKVAYPGLTDSQLTAWDQLALQVDHLQRELATVTSERDIVRAVLAACESARQDDSRESLVLAARLSKRVSSQTAATRLANGRLLQVVRALRALHACSQDVTDENGWGNRGGEFQTRIREAGEVLAVCIGIE